MKVLSHEMSLREAAEQREGGGVTIGSYYQTVQQARKKVRSSSLTLIVALWLGLVKVEDLRRLFDVAGKGIPNLAKDKENRLMMVLDALINKIVM